MADQVLFNATLEDNVTPNLEKLEQQLKAMGQSPVQIRMILNAVDNSTPKIKEAQQQIDRLPKTHTITLDFKGAIDKFKEEMIKMKEEVAKPITVPFKFVDDKGQNAEQAMSKLFTIREKLALPLIGSLPGSNMLYGVGAGAGIAGAITGVSGVAQQSFAANSEEQQAIQKLTVALRDNAGATVELNKVISASAKTPFTMQQNLQADIIGRSFQMPVFAGENKQVPQGYLKMAGNMAAAMGSDPGDAMMALAMARQGNYRRMQMYGAKMTAQDFGPGGRFAGESRDQALEQVTKRFQGAMDSQMQTFQGMMSNIKDVLHEQLIKPVGKSLFEAVQGTTGNVEQKLQSPQEQAKLGQAVEKIQHLTVQMLQDLQKVREYFDVHLRQSIENVVTVMAKLGKEFAQAFGGGAALAIQTFANALATMVNPAAQLAKQVPVLAQLAGYMKAAQMVGMGGAVKPLQTFFNAINPMNSTSPLAVFKAIGQLPAALTKMAGFLVLRDITSASRASADMNNQFREAGKHLDDINSKVGQMALGLGESDTHMKNLVASAAQGIPEGRMKPMQRANLAVDTARAGVLLSRDTGLDAHTIVQAIEANMKSTDTYSKSALHDFGTQLLQTSAVAKELGVSFNNVAQIMQTYAQQAGPIGLGNLKGAPALTALATTVNRYGVTKEQTAAGLYSPDEVLKDMLQRYRNPYIQDLSKIPKGQLGRYWNLQFNNAAVSKYGQDETTYEQGAASGQRAQSQSMAEIRRMAPSAVTGPYAISQIPNIWQTQGLSTNFGSFRSGANANPGQAAERVKAAWAQTVENYQRAQEQITKYQTAVEQTQNKLDQLNQAQAAVNLQMQAAEHAIAIAQRGVEDLSLSIQKYTYDNLRPLEEALTRVQHAMDVVNHTMSDAQYNMTKYSDGLLTGEQAALNQLHALQLYNEQLNYLKMQYTQIGAQLGTQVYERGYSARVQPLMGLSLEMQTQQLQRRQQMAQAQYDITYGEGHYQMQQAQRTQWQKMEMPLSQRLAGITQNQQIIDKATIQSHNLGEVQFQLQQKMFPVNQAIQAQNDHLQKLQMNVTALQQSPHMRALQDEQYNLGQKIGTTNQELDKQNKILAQWQNTIDDINQKKQDLQNLFDAMLTFNQSGSAGAFSMSHKIINEAVQTGQIPKQEGQRLNDAITKAQQAADKATKAHQTWWNDRTSVVKAIREGVWGFFTGDTFRKFGDKVGGPGGTALHVVGDIAPIASTVVGGMALSTAAVWGMRRLLLRFIPESWLNLLSKGAPKLGGALENVPLLRRMAPTLSSLDSPKAFREKLGGTLKEALAKTFEPFRHPNKFFGEGLGRAIFTALGHISGLPFGGALGGAVGAKFGKDITLTGFIKGLGRMTHSLDAIRHPIQTFKEASGKAVDAAKHEAANVKERARAAVKEGEARVRDTAKFGEHVGEKSGFGKWIREMAGHFKALGGHVFKFGGFVAAFGLVTDGIKKLIDLIPGVHIGSQGNPLHKAGHVAGTASGAHTVAKDAAKLAGEGNPISRLFSHIPSPIRKGLRIAGKAAGWGLGAASFIPGIMDLAKGHTTSGLTSILDSAEYLAPIIGQSKMGLDLLGYNTTPGAHGIPGFNSMGIRPGGYGPDYYNARQDALNHPRLLAGPRLNAAEQNALAHGTEGQIARYNMMGDPRKQKAYLDQVIRENQAAQNGIDALYAKHADRRRQMQDQFHKLSLKNQLAYYKLDLSQQLQAQVAATTGPNGLQTYLDALNHHLNNHWTDRIKALSTGYQNELNTHNAGFKAISGTTGSWLSGLTKQIDNWSKQMGLPLTKGNAVSQGVGQVAVSAVQSVAGAVGSLGNLFTGKAAGGLVEAKKQARLGTGQGGHLVRMAEEGHPEMVIPLAPHRRDRARSLLKQTAGLLGARRRNSRGEFITHGDIRGYAAGGYVWPYSAGITSGRIDEGWDMAGSGQIAAIGDTGPLQQGQSGWPGTGQGYYYQLKSGIRAGQYVYNYENIQRLKPLGYQAKAGEVLANLLPGYPWLEAGWSTASGAPTSQGRYTEGVPQPEGYDFQRFLQGLAHGQLIGGGGSGTVANFKPISLTGPPAALLGKGIVGGRQYRILQKKVQDWQKALNAKGQSGNATTTGNGGVAALPGGWFQVGATIDPTAGQAPTYSDHGGFSFAELLEAGTNAGMRPDLTQVLGLPRGGYGMAMETPIWVRMPNASKMFKIFKNDVGSGQAGNPHFKIDLHQAIANALGWSPNQDVQVKRAASGGWIGNPGERGRDNVPVVAGRGEAILNHHQQGVVNTAMAIAGMGSLHHLFNATKGTRHNSSGPVDAFQHLPQFASGGYNTRYSNRPHIGHMFDGGHGAAGHSGGGGGIGSVVSGIVSGISSGIASGVASVVTASPVAQAHMVGSLASGLGSAVSSAVGSYATQAHANAIAYQRAQQYAKQLKGVKERLFGNITAANTANKLALLFGSMNPSQSEVLARAKLDWALATQQWTKTPFQKINAKTPPSISEQKAIQELILLGRGFPSIRPQLLLAGGKADINTPAMAVVLHNITGQSLKSINANRAGAFFGAQLTGNSMSVINGAPLSTTQRAFGGELAKLTGLDPGLIAAWIHSEQPPTGLAPNGAYNWLNLGATDSGFYGGNNPAWRNPISAAKMTAAWLRGQSAPGFGTASAGIQDFMRHAPGRPVAEQIALLQNSGWASSHYPQLASVYNQIKGTVKLGNMSAAGIAALNTGASPTSSIGSSSSGGSFGAAITGDNSLLKPFKQAVAQMPAANSKDGSITNAVNSALNTTGAVLGGFPNSSNTFIGILGMSEGGLADTEARAALAAGGYAGGLPRVPRDKFPALLHKDEMVIPAAMAIAARGQARDKHSPYPMVPKDPYQNDFAGPRPRLQHSEVTKEAGWIAFAEQAAKQLKSIQSIETDIHKVEKELKKDKGKQKVKDEADLKKLNAQLRAARAAHITNDQKYYHAVAKNLTWLKEPSAGENTLAGVTKERRYTSAAALKEAEKHNKSLQKAQHKLHNDLAAYHKYSARVHRKGHHETKKERQHLQQMQRVIAKDRRNISNIETGIKHGLVTNYLDSAAKRGVNVGLMKAILGKGLNRTQTSDYVKLQQAFNKAMRTGGNMNSKAIKQLEAKLARDMFSTAKQANTNAKKTETTSKKHAADAIKATRQHIAETKKMNITSSRHASDAIKVANTQVNHLKANAEAVKGAASQATKAAASTKTHEIKHETHMAKHESHMSKTEAHQKSLEQKMDKLLSKDTVVNITALVDGKPAKAVTRVAPKRRAK